MAIALLILSILVSCYFIGPHNRMNMQSVTKRIVVYMMGSVLFLMAKVTPVSAAVLSFQTATSDWPIGATQVLELRLDSAGEVVNALEAAITYPTELVDVVAITHGGSTFTVWPDEPQFDAEAGLITFTAGIPNGSYIDAGQVLTLVVRPKVLGSIQLKFIPDQTAIYLNDGFATKVPLSFDEPIYQSVAAPTSGLVITSPTHPNAYSWYQATQFTAQWQKKADAAYSFQIADQVSQPLDDTPDPTAQTLLGEYTTSDLKDGVHYFMIKEKLSEESGWSEPTIRTVMVDSTPPIAFTVSLQQTEQEFAGAHFLVFNTTDLTSGVDHYEVVEGETHTTVSHGPFKLIHPNIAGLVEVRAVDAAGNVMVSSVENSALTVSNNWVWAMVGILILVLSFLVIIVVTRQYLRFRLHKT